MGTLQLLPDNILRAQACQECSRYLSVGPITINRQGEKICGRCNSDNIVNTKSLLNIVVEGLWFKCTNHYNGCKEKLPFEEIKEHENTCLYEPHPQECFFCSFSGNLSQILNHSLKIHPDNVSIDGIISFSLSGEQYKKTLLFVFEDNIFLITIKISETLFLASIQLLTSNLAPTVKQYELKFYKPDEPSNFDFILTDYGLFHDKFLNCFEKPLEQFVSFFGPATTLYCQILLGTFTLKAKEREIQKRYAKLRSDEENLSSLKQEVATERQELYRKSECYDSATNVIKILSRNLLKCTSCGKICPTDMYFCPKIHCYCKNCLTSICKECKTPRVFKRLIDVENFKLSCDFPECNSIFEIKDYLIHTTVCSNRPYKCPLQDCNKIIFSADKLIGHWHSDAPNLFNEEIFVLTTYKCEEFYWLFKNNLYHVLINFAADLIQVLINEINVLGDNPLFTCEGYCLNLISQGHQTQTPNDGWSKITASEFCGKFLINKPNSETTRDQYGYNRAYCYTKLKIQ